MAAFKDEQASISICEVLGSDLLERILLRLPLSACLRMACVCKTWYTIISSPAFYIQFVQSGKPLCIFVWPCFSNCYFEDRREGFLPLSSSEALRYHDWREAFMFEHLTKHWFKFWLKDNRRGNPGYHLVGTSLGPLFIFANHLPSTPKGRPPHGLTFRNPLFHSLSPRRRTSPPLARLYESSNLVVVTDKDSSSHSFKVFVLGGNPNSNCPFQLYDFASDSWELILSPSGLAYPYYSGVVGQRVYVISSTLWSMAYFDVYSKLWSMVSDLDFPVYTDALIRWTSNRSVIFLLVRVQDESILELFRLDESTFDLKKMSMFSSTMRSKNLPMMLLCVGSDNQVYVQEDSNLYVCDCSKDYSWEVLPSLPCSKSSFRGKGCSLEFALASSFTKVNVLQ
ncbi:hypothetical protein L7F22_021011 [Adiantum nelumboides]|nr:hypothetical protein [Adiantum nelumboides]